ncbi:MAG: hypothetical protein JWM11_5641 [Planctomycetaceae bacterium]|nr:hypothetical protein [Planctomycetaceae bacterium]
MLQTRDTASLSRSQELWSAFLVGTLGYTLLYLVQYALAERCCQWHSKLVLHSLSLLSLIGIVCVTVPRWQEFRAQLNRPEAPHRLESTPTQFLSLLVLLSNSLFLLVVIALWLAVILLDPCPSTL